ASMSRGESDVMECLITKKKNGSSLPENDESNVSISAADKKSAACRASSRRRHAVFKKRKKQAAGRTVRLMTNLIPLPGWQRATNKKQGKSIY
uniref:hypothetical protein n=1 Tax=Serratia marcescens TaxID=615 RepID=UPI001C379256